MIPKGIIWLSAILRIIFFVVLSVIMIISFSSDNNWVGFMVGGCIVYWSYKRWKERKFINHLATCYSGLKQMRDEIETTAYNSKHISEKLKEQEKNGVYVPSIAYSLLECVDKIPLEQKSV